MNSRGTQSDSAVVFHYAIGPGWMVFAATDFVLGVFAVYEFATESQTPSNGAFLTILCLLLMTTVWRYAKPRVREGAFYEDYARVKERGGLHTEFKYSDIQSISVRKSWLFGPRTEVVVAGKPEPYVFVRNPRDGNRGVDLVSWLTQKTAH